MCVMRSRRARVRQRLPRRRPGCRARRVLRRRARAGNARLAIDSGRAVHPDRRVGRRQPDLSPVPTAGIDRCGATGGDAARRLRQRCSRPSVPTTGTPRPTAGHFLVAYPDGLNRAWNAGTCCGEPQRVDADDVGFITTMVGAIEREMPDRSGARLCHRHVERGHDGAPTRLPDRHCSPRSLRWRAHC